MSNNRIVNAFVCQTGDQGRGLHYVGGRMGKPKSCFARYWLV